MISGAAGCILVWGIVAQPNIASGRFGPIGTDADCHQIGEAWDADQRRAGVLIWWECDQELNGDGKSTP